MKKIYLALILFLLVMVVGCGKETEQKKNPYFQATVLEVKENSILVEPFEGEQELDICGSNIGIHRCHLDSRSA